MCTAGGMTSHGTMETTVTLCCGERHLVQNHRAKTDSFSLKLPFQGVLASTTAEETLINNSSKKFFKKLPYIPATPLWGIYSKELKAETKTDICVSIFITA